MRLDIGKLNAKQKKALGVAVLTAVYFCAVGIFYWLVHTDWQRAFIDVESVNRGFTTVELKEGVTARHSFSLPLDYLDQLTLEVNRWGEDDAAMLRVALEQDGALIWDEHYPYGAADEDGRLAITFSKPLDMRHHPITLLVEGQGGLALWCGNTRTAGRFVVEAGRDTTLSVNGEALEGQLVLSARGFSEFHVLPFFWPVAVLIYAVMLAYGLWAIDRPESLLCRIIETVKRYHYLLKQLVMRDFRVKYQASVLGVLWSFINPMLMTFVYHLVFSTIFKSSIENFTIYLMSGIILFNYFSEATSLSLISLVTNAPLITKVYIPKYVFPVSKTLSSAINLVISFVPLFGMMAITGVPFTKSLLLIPLLLVFLIAFTMGMGLILSSMNVFFRDTRFLWSVLVMIWNFLTPIFYPDSIIPLAYQRLYRLNPLYHICTFSRMIIMHGASPVPSSYLVCLVSSFGVLALGIYVYHKSQDKFFLYL